MLPAEQHIFIEEQPIFNVFKIMTGFVIQKGWLIFHVNHYFL